MRPVIVCLVAWVVVGYCAGFIHAASDNWIFTKIAETGDSIPEGGGNTFLSISDASIDDGQIVFIGGGQRVRGVYKWRDGVLTALADTAPGGAPDILAVDGSPRISGDTTVFRHTAAVFAVTDGGALQTVADRNITPPGSDRNFAAFFHAAVSGAQTVYSADVGAIGAGSADGIYSGASGGAGATLIADKSTPVPGVGGETFGAFGLVPSVSDSAVAFTGSSSLGWGIYSAEKDGSNPQVVADPATPVPGFDRLFGSQISAIPSLSGDTVAFASTGYGVYTRSRGQDIGIVADTNTSPPGSSDTFGRFSGTVAISGNTVAFGASGFGGGDVPNGIYISSPCGGLELLVRERDTIEGETVSRLRFSNAALDGDMIVFSARTSGGKLALFLATRTSMDSGSNGDPPSDLASCNNLCALEQIAKERKGTDDELYAKFWLCLNEGTCDEYMRTGDEGIAGGFNKFMFNYMNQHSKNSTFFNFKCMDTDLNIEPDFVIANKLECFEAAGNHHFRNELQPGFRAYCDKITPDQYDAWDAEHEEFVETVNLPCFNTTIKGAGIKYLPDETIAIQWARFQTKRKADKLREDIQAECLGLQPTLQNRSMDFSDSNAYILDPPPPPTREELFSEELATAGTLTVIGEDETRFFLPEGTQIQLRVTKRNPDGSVTDVTSSPEIRYSIPLSKDFVSITPEGVLSVLASPSLFASDRPLLTIFVRYGDDQGGVGQFAIVPNDTDDDLLADSYEVRFGLDPNTPNDVRSDVDGDGLTDRTELMLNTQPTLKDTDGDGFNDETEFKAGTDPRDGTSHPEDGSQPVP